MRKLLFLLFFFPLTLFAKESVVPAFEGEPSAIIHNSVDAITGAFFQTELDLEVSGPEPIQMIRAYNSWDDFPDATMGMGWHFNGKSLKSHGKE